MLLIVEGLAARNWSVVDDFLPRNSGLALEVEIGSLSSAGVLRPAAVAGTRDEEIVLPNTRGDCIQWWEPGALSPAQRPLWDSLETLRLKLNEELFLGLRGIEAHFAHYPPGAGYLKHVDNKRGSENRVISCAFYLNSSWEPGDGGELTLFPGGEKPVVIEPRAGRLAVFLSEGLPHEVAPNRSGRSSVVAWLNR